MTHIAFALGTNIGDRRAHLQYAIERLRNHDEISVISVSKVYETQPVGGPDQDNYLNAVVTAESTLSARELLAFCHEIENARDRMREVRWGPRTLDVDLLVVGDEVSQDPSVMIPHPRAHERAFVLTPWESIDPLCLIPGHGTVQECSHRVDSAGVWLSELQIVQVRSDS